MPPLLYKHNIQIKCYRGKRSEESQVLKDAVEFFLNELFKRCTIDYKLNIVVSLTNGHAVSEDGAINDGLAWKEVLKGEDWYFIELPNFDNFLKMLSTIAHECVHVSQLATKRLETVTDGWYWEGKFYGSDPYTQTDVDFNLPWEYDAYSKETNLAKKFVVNYYSNW